jgi:hypothetical protein
MPSHLRARTTESASMNGHHAQDASVTPSTRRPRAGVEEAFKGPAGKLAAALIGLCIFGVSFTAFRLTDTPPEGVRGLLLEVSGWLGMLTAARIVTRRWLASSLVLTAWLLLVVGNSFGTRLIQRGTDWGLELGFNYVTALITLEGGVWLLVAVLMLDGAARLWREDTRACRHAARS